MNVQILRNELQHVLSGKSSVRFGGTLQSITGYLSNCSGTSGAFEDQKRFKKQEEERLISFITAHHLWLNNLDFSQYVSEGASTIISSQIRRMKYWDSHSMETNSIVLSNRILSQPLRSLISCM